MKTCTKCKKSKNEADFHRSKIHKGGRKPRCKVCRNEANTRHRAANPEYYQKWRDDNKDIVKAHNAKYHAANREKANAKRLERTRQNPEAEKEKQRKWYLANRDKVIARKRRRRDRQAGCNENYTKSDERVTLQAFGNKCFNCDRKDKLHIDHHRPLIKGFGLSINNAVVLCETCNLSKGTKDPEDFYGKKICAKLDNKLAKLKEQATKEK